MSRTVKSISLSALLVVVPSAASAQLWQDVTDDTIGTTAQWSNKVELADVDGDGLVDILFANGGNYNEPGTPEQNRIFLNQGAGLPFREATTEILGPVGDLARVIKARDLNRDGNTDIIVGATYQTQSRLYLGEGGGAFTEVTATNLPQIDASIGDLEIGDVDGDGNLDIVLADWGAGDPFESAGGRVMLWLGDGTGSFVDATDKMPTKKVRWSWDLELLDVDNDMDLDVAVSCKVCTGSSLFHNKGDGTFTDESDRLPQFTNNYEFEPVDLNGDGFLDMVTINDGDQLSNQFDRREHIFLADGLGGFVDGTEDLWPDAANIGEDDNVAVVLDFDSDGDPDFLIGSLSGSDRLLINDGEGRLSLDEDVFGGSFTSGTLGLAVADLNGDGKLDVVQSQGELAEDERVYFGAGIAVDTAAPAISLVSAVDQDGQLVVRARIHDNKTPVMDFDFESVTVELTTKSGTETAELVWYGESLWSAVGDAEGVTSIRVCATDARGNESCSEPVAVEDEDKKDDLDPSGDEGGCSTASTRSEGLGWMLALCALVALRRRRA